MARTAAAQWGLDGPPRHFIGGTWHTPHGAATIAVENPATGACIGEIADGCAQDVDSAVTAATLAMRQQWTPAQRQDALLDLARTIEANAEAFAQIETLDAGKPIANSRRVDVPGAASVLRYFAGWATKLSGETMELSQPGRSAGFIRREPVGAVGQIIPWNYPLMGAAFKIGPAIAAGCAVVLKPAEQTALSALKLAELTASCGFLPGFVNVVTGCGPTAGAALVDHADIAKISFTGSTATGISIAVACARQMKRATVELGGKSPIIVMPDADLDAAAPAIAMNIFFNSGQTCSAGSRLFVHASVAAPLMERIVAIGRTLRLGPPDDPATQIGPVISARQRERIEQFILDAKAQGARAVLGGDPVEGPGHYVSPTILTDVSPGMAVVDEEIFGPVLCALPFESMDLDEIAALANGGCYGLAAYVWTRDLATAHGLVARLKAGTVRVNAVSGDLSMPAGGVKMSGFGRENGRAGVEAYTELKSVTMAY